MVSPTQPPHVVAISATYRRPLELRRLAASLGALSESLSAWIIVDNAGDLDLAEISALCRVPVVTITPPRNLGCGGALAAGEKLALTRFGSELTHVWNLDDDAVVEPDSLRTLLEAMSSEQANVAVPAVLDSRGELTWMPGLLDTALLRTLKTPHSAEKYAARWGDTPKRLLWAQGIALLVTRRALEDCGVHRDDYGVRGEDIEFSLRITNHHLGLFVPAARVAHLPPKADPPGSPTGEYAKNLALVRNSAYTALRLPHGRRIARHLPHVTARFIRTWGLRPRVLFDAARAFWQGAILGPAGSAR